MCFWCENAIHNFNSDSHHSNRFSGDELFLTYFGNFYLSCWSVCFSRFHPTQSETHMHKRTPFVQRFYVCDFWSVVKYTHKSLCSSSSRTTHSHVHKFYYLCLVSHCLLCVCVCVMLLELHLQWKWIWCVQWS